MVSITWLSPFLYSRLQSRSMILGFSMRLFILGWVTSLLTMTPDNTQESEMLPPGICKLNRSENFPLTSSMLLIYYLFHFSVSLDINLLAAIFINRHGVDSIESNIASQIRPAADEFCAYTRIDDLQQFTTVVDVQFHTKIVYIRKCFTNE